MNEEEQNPQPYRRLPEGDGDGYRPPGRSAPGRDLGIRQVRRVSNWTAATLIVAAAATAGYFAHASGSAGAASGPAGTKATAGATTGRGQPCISVPVAVSGGSGVTAAPSSPVRVCGSSTSAPVVINVPRPSGEGD